MTLPADVARCPGYQADGEWREGCEDCPLVPAEVEPSLLDPCTCLRDGKHCRVCRLLDKHIAWFEARPEPNGDTEQCRARAT